MYAFGEAYNPRWTQYKVTFAQPVSGVSGVGVRLLVDNVVTALSVNGAAAFGCTFVSPCAGFYGTPFALVVPDPDLNARGADNTLIITVFNGAAGQPDGPNPNTTGALDFDIVSGGPALQAAAPDRSAQATVLMTTSGSFKQAFQSDSAVPMTLSAGTSVGDFVDHGDGTWTWSYRAPKGSTPGAYPITVTASSAGGTDAIDEFQYTVLTTPDNAAPVVTAPATPAHAEATGTAGAVVTFGPATVTDDVDANTTAACIPASGSTFAVGNTLVTCSYVDVSGKPASATVTVTVVDTTAPVLTVPGQVGATATSAGSTAVTYSVTATDAADGAIPATCTPSSGSAFAVGATTVTCRATDAAGNVHAATFVVTVAPWVKPVTPPSEPVATPPVPDATMPLVSIDPITRANRAAGPRTGRVDIGCKLPDTRITRCETTLIAVVNGKRVVIGQGVETIAGSGTRKRVTVTNKLTALGRKLLNRPGGVKVRVRATIFVAGSDMPLRGTARTQLVPSGLVMAPGDGLFATRSSVISEAGIRYLEQLRGRLDQVKRIDCVGFTDSLGSEADNRALGKRRAKVVCAFVAHNRKLQSSSSSRGEHAPRATNTTAAGRALNRRVEIHLEY
ncbi:MAG: HYR domain-containing protein [Solirubrobacteraceae bacterium]|nr:HYR domain-containing protein [Solirubrobacteraceae bacterium]